MALKLVRRNREEMLDQAGLDPALLAEDLRNLETLNRLFGGRDVVRRRLRRLLEVLPPAAPVSVLDIGSGAGDLCGVIVEECRRRGHLLRLYSLDAHPQIQAYARERWGQEYPEVRFMQGDARGLPLRDRSIDLAICTLALHHFTEPDAVRVLAEMNRVSRRWAVVSDLRRSSPAYAAVWLATRFMANPMTRHDGPVSVQRAYTEEELRDVAARGGWISPEFYPEPWFRMSLVCRKDLPCQTS
jgi:ubiquinone/menaquinone biosynthesis C-methylase UbiE